MHVQAEFAADPNFVYSERITWKQSIALMRIPTNLYIFIQGLPGCLPWGVLLTYLTDYLAQNKGLSVQTATMVSTTTPDPANLHLDHRLEPPSSYSTHQDTATG